MAESHQAVLSEKAHTASMFRSVIRLSKAQGVCQTRKVVYEYEVSILDYFGSLCSFPIPSARASLCHHRRQQRSGASYCAPKALSTVLLITPTALPTPSLSLNPGISCPPSCTKTLLTSPLHNQLNTGPKVGYSPSFLPQICAVGTSIISLLFS